MYNTAKYQAVNHQLLMYNTAKSVGERILKIGQHFATLIEAKMQWHRFFSGHGVNDKIICKTVTFCENTMRNEITRQKNAKLS